MDINQPASTTVYVQPPPSPGVLGSKIPSAAAFIVAILLFLMPFVDIKCNGSSLKKFSGVELATGYKVDTDGKSNSLLDKAKETTVDNTAKVTDKSKRSLYMLIALIVGGVGLILSFTNVKAFIAIAMLSGILSAGGMIMGMIDIKKDAKISAPNLKDKTPDNDVGNTIDKIGDKMSDLTSSMKITVDFTPWFYIAVVAFLAAAFFCYRRMAASKN
ncbi:MAG: hypothetical protein SGI83_06365 [Bacteroidota bacterium]|nr:hypothetical protein [Bacteroidota bacterium]